MYTASFQRNRAVFSVVGAVPAGAGIDDAIGDEP